MLNDAVDPAGILDGYTEAENYSQSQAESVVVAKFQEKLRIAKNHRYKYSQDWERNRAYLDGDQLLFRDVNSHEYVRLNPTNLKRLYSVNNQLQPAGRKLHGKLCRVQPNYHTVPATTEQDEVHGARVADAYIGYFNRKHKMELLYSIFQHPLLYSGSSVIELQWDPMAGRKLAYCEKCEYSAEEDLIGADCPDCMTEFGEQTTLEEACEGAEQPIVHQIENVYVDPAATDSWNMEWLITACTVSMSELRSRYPEKGIFASPSAEVYIEDTSFRQTGGDFSHQDSYTLQDHTVLYTYHEKPSGMYPKGRILSFCNDILLEEQEGYYDLFGRLPFYWNFWWKTPGRFWAQSPCDQAKDRQKELNELETQFREYQELIARTKIKVPLGAGISADELNGKMGQYVAYNPTTRGPEYMVPPEMPQTFLARRQLLIDDIHNHFALSALEASGAGVEAGAGRSLALLEASGDQQLSGILKYNYSEMKEFYRCLLIMAKHFYRPERKFVISGDKGPEQYSFEDLKLTEGWDLELEQMDGFSSNPAIRQQEVANLLALGMFMDHQTGTPDESRVAKAANLKIPGVALDVRSTEYSAAQANLKRIEKGDFNVQPEVEDDAEIFAEAFLHWLRSKGRRSPPEQVEFVRHMYMYYQQQIMMAQQAAAGMAAREPQGSSGGSKSPRGGTPTGTDGMGAEGRRDAALAGSGVAGGQSAGGQAAGRIKAADAIGESLAGSYSSQAR